jgi:hypothetical protein
MVNTRRFYPGAACVAVALTFLLTACGGDTTSAKEPVPTSSSSSAELYDDDGNILHEPADRRIDTGATADYRDVITKIGLTEKDQTFTSDDETQRYFDKVHGTECRFVLTLLGVGIDTHFVASLRSPNGEFGLDEEYLESEKSFKEALKNSGC